MQLLSFEVLSLEFVYKNRRVNAQKNGLKA